MCAAALIYFGCYGYADHRDLHVLTHSCPTRRSADLDAKPLPLHEEVVQYLDLPLAERIKDLARIREENHADVSAELRRRPDRIEFTVDHHRRGRRIFRIRRRCQADVL